MQFSFNVMFSVGFLGFTKVPLRPVCEPRLDVGSWVRESCKAMLSCSVLRFYSRRIVLAQIDFLAAQGLRLFPAGAILFQVKATLTLAVFTVSQPPLH